jgi:hypothetical protein
MFPCIDWFNDTYLCVTDYVTLFYECNSSVKTEWIVEETKCILCILLYVPNYLPAIQDQASSPSRKVTCADILKQVVKFKAGDWIYIYLLDAVQYIGISVLPLCIIII